MSKFSRILTILLGLSPSLGWAANIFDPVLGDKSMTLLASLFGSLGTFGSSGADPFSTVMGVFNGAVLTVGGILAAYTILAGTLGTAHDGEMLGKKFSSVWIPIRYGIGTALILPVLPGGYCVMQGIVAWLIVQGIGLADNVWSTYTKATNLSTSSAVGFQRPEAKALGYNIFQSLVCLKALAAVADDKELAVLNGGASFGATLIETNDKRVIYFGDKNKESSREICGSVTVKKSQKPTTAGTAPTLTIIGGIMDAVSSMERMKAISDANWIETNKLITNLSDLADILVTTRTLPDPTMIDQKIVLYEEALKAKAAAEILAMDPFKEISRNASQDGWIMAGAWFMKLSYLSDLISRSMSDVPESSPPKQMTSAVFGEKFVDLLKPLSIVLEKTKSGMTTFGVSHEPGGSNTSWFDTVSDAVTSLTDPSILIKKAFTSTANFALQDGEHPIMAMKRLGNWVLGIAGSAYVVCLVALSTAGNAPGVGFAIFSAVMLFIPPLLMAGFTLSYVLPMIPFFIWLGVIISWLIQCVEAMIAAPLWAVMHLHPNGDDLTGKGANGYNLVLTLVLRPVLMIFGLIAALSMVVVLGGFVNRIFADVFIASQQDSGILVFLVGMIATPFIYCGVMYMLIKKMFSVIHVIPDELLKWFGGNGGGLRGGADAMGGQGTFIAANQMAQMAGRGGEVSAQIRGAKERKTAHEDKQEEAKRATQEKKDFTALEDSKNNREFDGEFGAGASEKRNESLGPEATNLEKSDYQSGMSNAKNVGGDEAASEFESKFAEAAQNNFAGFRSKSHAAESISKDVQQNSLMEQAGNMDSNAAGFIKAASAEEGGGFNTNKAKQALKSLDKAKTVMGGANFAQTLSKAIAKATDKSGNVDANIAQSFMKDAYSKAKSSGGGLVDLAKNNDVEDMTK